MAVSSIVDLLSGRLDAEAAAARAAIAGGEGGEMAGTFADPRRVLADVEAKRRILARHQPGERGAYAWITGDWCAGCGTTGEDNSPRTEDINTCPELLDLASAYTQ